MARYSNTLRDTPTLAPVGGALITVTVSSTGATAYLTDDIGNALPQPLVSNPLGFFYFNAADDIYDLSYLFGGQIVREDNVLVGLPNAFIGPAGPAFATYITLASFKAAAVTNKVQVLQDPSIATGLFNWETINAPYIADNVNIIKADSTSLSIGAWVRQSSTSTTFIQSGTGVVTRAAQDKMRERKTVNDFGAIGDGTLHTVAEWIGAGKRFANLAALQVVYPHVTATTDSLDWAAIQAALNSITGYFGTVVLVQDAQYVTNKSIVALRGRNIVGDGSPQITADFSGSGWSGDYVAIKYLVSSSATNTYLNEAYGQFSGGFRLSGSNNAGVLSTGVKFYTSVSITVGQAVNYSWLWGRFSNVIIRRFDTGIEMRECWNSSFIDINITYCRRGLYIDGKSVNVGFVNMQVQNPVNTYTSSTASTIGIEMENGTQYSDAPGRPEGLSFIGGLIYGHYNNLKITSTFQTTFNDMVLDGATNNCVLITNPDFVSIEDCYIYTSGTSLNCVFFLGVAVGSSSSISIKNNNLVGSDGTQNGVTFEAAGVSRQGVTIEGNKAHDLASIVNALQCPTYSRFVGNYGEFMSGARLIYVQTGGQGTIIDGNTCGTTGVQPVACHPTTSPLVEIGNNSSPTYNTSFAGKVTIAAGATTALLPNSFYGAEVYIRSVTQATPNGNAGTWFITEEASGSAAQITLGAALGSAITVRYTTKMLPYSATV